MKRGGLSARNNENLLFTVVRGPVPGNAICLKQDFQDVQDFQEYEVFDSTCFFRSVRTCMSIETHVGAFSRSARSLICGRYLRLN